MKNSFIYSNHCFPNCGTCTSSGTTDQQVVSKHCEIMSYIKLHTSDKVFERLYGHTKVAYITPNSSIQNAVC